MLFELSYHGSYQTIMLDLPYITVYKPKRPLFVLQDMVAIPFLITLDFYVCNFNLVLSDSSSAELWLSVDTHYHTMQDWSRLSVLF